MGKVNSWLCAVLALTLAVAGAPARADIPVDLELVLAADGSGSIDDEELKFQDRKSTRLNSSHT